MYTGYIADRAPAKRLYTATQPIRTDITRITVEALIYIPSFGAKVNNKYSVSIV